MHLALLGAQVETANSDRQGACEEAVPQLAASVSSERHELPVLRCSLKTFDISHIFLTLGTNYARKNG